MSEGPDTSSFAYSMLVIVIVGLAIVAAEHQLPDLAGYGIADEAHAAVRKAGVDPAKMPTAGLRLPVGPIVRRVFPGTAHPVPRTKFRVPVELAVFHVIRQRFAIVGGGTVADGSIGGSYA